MTDDAGLPWPAGAATGVGSMPGTDVRDAARTVLGELPDLPHLPELPARGPGADMLGRGTALLVELYADLQPAGWRLVPRPGRDSRRAAALLREDLDALEEAGQGFAGALKVQACGPWTLAAGVELERGERVVSDPGAARDVAVSLAEGVAAHVAEVRRRVPGATVVLQLDEPSVPAVLAGRLPTASGYGRLRAVEPAVVADGLRRVLAASGADRTVVHCCAADPPLTVLRRAGAGGISVDLSQVGTAYDEALGEAVDAGLALLLGVVPATDTVLPDPADSVSDVRRVWHRLGFPADALAASVVVTPTCGLAGASPGYARAAMAHARAAARTLVDDPEG